MHKFWKFLGFSDGGDIPQSKILTPEGRISFPNLVAPAEDEMGNLCREAIRTHHEKLVDQQQAELRAELDAAKAEDDAERLAAPGWSPDIMLGKSSTGLTFAVVRLAAPDWPDQTVEFPLDYVESVQVRVSRWCATPKPVLGGEPRSYNGRVHKPLAVIDIRMLSGQVHMLRVSRWKLDILIGALKKCVADVRPTMQPWSGARYAKD